MALVRNTKTPYRFLIWKTEKKTQLGRPRHRWEDHVKTDLKEVGRGVAQEEVAGYEECGRELSGSVNCGKFLD